MFLEVADCGDGLLDWNWNWNWWVWGLEGLTFGADGGYFGVKVLVHGGCGVCWGVHGGGGLFVYGGESRDDKIRSGRGYRNCVLPTYIDRRPPESCTNLGSPFIPKASVLFIIQKLLVSIGHKEACIEHNSAKLSPVRVGIAKNTGLMQSQLVLFDILQSVDG